MLEVLAIIGNVITEYKEYVSKAPKSHSIFLIAALSIFMPFIVTCVTAVLVAFLALREKEYLKSIKNLPGVAYIVAFAALVLLVPLFYGRWVSLLAGLLVIVALIFMLFSKSIMTEALYDRALDCCCAGSTICFLFGIIQKIYYGPRFRVTAGFGNANYYGTIIEFVILICVYRIMTNPKGRWFYCGIILMNVLGLFLCDCQSSWLPILVGVLIIFYCNGHKKKTIIFLCIAVGLVAALLLIPNILPRLDRMPQTFATRINIWLTAAQGIKAHPIFGQGTITYMFIHSLYNGYSTYHAHSLYLDPLLNYGVAGVALALRYFWVVISDVQKKRLGVKSRPIKSLALAVVVGVLIHGVTDITIMWIPTAMLLTLILSSFGIEDKKNICCSY